ncbi:Ataxin-7-like protein 3 [Glycine soja]
MAPPPEITSNGGTQRGKRLWKWHLRGCSVNHRISVSTLLSTIPFFSRCGSDFRAGSSLISADPKALLGQDSFMSVPNEENLSSHSQLSSHFFLDLLDSIIVDVASECHRVARLGLDSNLEEEDEELKLSAQARVRVADPSNSNEANGKYVVDIFGQTHPPVANEIFDCMNCGRSIMAGRFAPHLEKCMGKGRKARLKVTRSSTAAQNRYSRGSPSPGSTYSPYSNYSTNSMNRLANGTSTFAGEEHSNGTLES